MTFSLHQGGVVMSSQMTHTHTIINIHPLAKILGSCVLISVVFLQPFLQFIPTAWNPFPVDNHQSTGRRYERRQDQAKRQPKTHYMHQGSLLFPIFRVFSRSPHRHSSVAQGHLHTIHPNLGLPPLALAKKINVGQESPSEKSTPQNVGSIINYLVIYWSSPMRNS